MMSHAIRISPFDSASGLPCSCVIQRAIVSARSFRRRAASRIVLARSKAGTLRQASKPCCAAAHAASRSALVATATLPTGLPVAGSFTASVLRSPPSRHWPPMNNCTDG
jgi:hypothetical protein